jgi:hypothetical protein
LRKIRFFELSRALQERFIASAKGTAPPAPIFSRLGTTRALVVHAAGAGAAVVVALVLTVVGYGSLGSSLSVQSFGALLVYALLFFAVPYGALRALGLRLEAKALPFSPGVYVFPMCIVDARTKLLRVAPMTDLVSVEPSTSGAPFRVAYKGIGTFEFMPSSGETNEQLKFQFENAQEQVKHANASGDETELVTLDPLYEPKKWTSPIGPQEPLVERVPAWVKLAWAVALGFMVVLAPSVWLVRNAASDDATLARAKQDGSPEAFRSYLIFGKRHTDEVQKVLLPRAELEVAKQQGTVEAIKDFIDAHPASAIDQEAQAALHDALVVELDKAKAKGTVAGLEAFAKKYPDHHLEAELGKARHALFAAALAKLKKAAPGATPDGTALYDKLFAWIEAHGPRVVVVMRREISQNLGQADKLIGASPLNKTLGGGQVTRYFPNEPQPKEADVASALGATLAKIVPPDMLRVERGNAPAPDATDEAIVTTTKAPVIVVRYRIGWQGVAFSSSALKRAFGGIHFTGDAALYVPGDARSLRAKIDVYPPKALLLAYDAPAHPGFATVAPADGAAPEPAIYGAQEMRALDLITSTLEQMVLPQR